MSSGSNKELLTTTNEDGLLKTAVATILDTYNHLDYTPQDLTWTILASFFFSRRPNVDAGTTGEVKVISIATGTKCLPASKLSKFGEIVHDSHAEAAARRSALRWFLEEIERIQTRKGFASAWIEESLDGRYRLQEGIELNLYVSTVPCGDASMRFLAAAQDEEMAALKNASAIPTTEIDPNTAARGRDNYARLGALRTKPGRADSPATLCMSCSDKIVKWNALGIQGAMGSLALEPLYLNTIVIGEVPADLQETVREDCERAFSKRVGNVEGLQNGYALHHPKIRFTDLQFKHSRPEVVAKSQPKSSVDCGSEPQEPHVHSKTIEPHGTALFWISDSETQTHHVLINGLKRGTAPKHRYRDKSRPLICRLSMAQLLNRTKPPTFPKGVEKPTYQDLKQLATDYQLARTALLGPNGPFSGWIFSGTEWQAFELPGYVAKVPEVVEARTTEEVA